LPVPILPLALFATVCFAAICFASGYVARAYVSRRRRHRRYRGRARGPGAPWLPDQTAARRGHPAVLSESADGAAPDFAQSGAGRAELRR
jgi:hypothetical protein